MEGGRALQRPEHPGACAGCAGRRPQSGRRRGSPPRRARARRRGRVARSSCPSRSRPRARPPRRARRRGRSRRARELHRTPSPGRGRRWPRAPAAAPSAAKGSVRRRRGSRRATSGISPSRPSPSTASRSTAVSIGWSCAGAWPCTVPHRWATSEIAPRMATPTTPAAAYPAPPSSTATSRRNEANGPNAFGSETPASCTASAPASPATVEETTNAPKRSESPGTPSTIAAGRLSRTARRRIPALDAAEDREEPDGDRRQPQRQLVVRLRPERRERRRSPESRPRATGTRRRRAPTSQARSQVLTAT